MTSSSLSSDARVAPVPRALLDALQGAGVDPAALARSLGLAPEALETGLGFNDADRFFCAAWDAVADPAMGLKAGSVMRPERFGVVGLAAMASPTFGVAVHRKARYWRLIWGDAYQVVQRGNEAAAVLTPSGPVRPYTQAKVDMELASLLAFGRHFTGCPIVPLRLTLVQSRPGWAAQYDRAFGCPVQYGRAENSLVFARADFDLPLVSRNAEVAALMAAGAESALERLGADTVALRSALVVDRLLQGEEPTLAQVADALHMGPRTLQRQLEKEGLRFTDVLDARRKEAALRHLRQARTTAEEVAFLLGFSTASSFFRAFRRWTGATPEAWRRAQRAAA